MRKILPTALIIPVCILCQVAILFLLVFGSSWNMTKRDSCVAGTFPSSSMSMPRRYSRSAGHTGNTTDLSESSHLSHYPTGHHESQTWPTHPAYGSGSHSHPPEYAFPSSSVPLSTTSSYQAPIIPQREEEAYPLQKQIAEQRRQLHAHYFVEVRTPHADRTQPDLRRLMVTEVDQHGVHQNRQPEFFFNGIIGHIRASRNGWIDSWDQSTKLANDWRRHFNIPEEIHNRTGHHHYEAPTSPASRPESSMDDADSTAANVDITPPPVQIHQLATILWNILSNDREANMAILERLEDPNDDLTRHPVQIFSAADLAHLASHLAESTRNLSDQAFQMEALSDISDWFEHRDDLSPRHNSGITFFPVFWSCVNRYIQFQGTNKSVLHHSWNVKKEPRGSEVCVCGPSEKM